MVSRRRNHFQTLLLILLLPGLPASVGWMLAGSTGLWLALGFGLLLMLYSGGFSPGLYLRSLGARPAGPAAWRLEALLGDLARRAGLPAAPRLLRLPSAMPNAFATGRPERSWIVVTDGLLRQLNLRELNGVLAHEISHIRHRDLRVLGLASAMASLTHSLSTLGQVLILFNLPLMLMGAVHIPLSALLWLLLAPLIARILLLALSRTREYEADRSAVELTGDVIGLAGALQKLHGRRSGFWQRFFPRPLPAPAGSPWLRSHPSLQERLERLGVGKQSAAGGGTAWM